MKRSRDPQCKTDVSHTQFDRRKSKCGCGSPLVVSCGVCEKLFSYAHFKQHEKGCQQIGEGGDRHDIVPRTVRFAYLQSDWKFSGQNGFETQPKGQFWDGLPNGAPVFRVHKVTDRSMPGQEWMDSYDAVFAHIASDETFECVHIFKDWQEVRTLVNATSPLSAVKALAGVNLIVLGNWVHDIVLKDGEASHEAIMVWHQRLERLELELDCRIFPPLDYIMYFARKEVYYRHLGRSTLPISLECIPTLFISHLQKSWKKDSVEFVGDAEAIVFKRSVSERKLHMHLVKKDAIKSLVLFDRGTKGLTWLVQPDIPQFREYNEIRLYFVGGNLLWGVTSNFDANGDIALFAFGKGLHGGEWDSALVHAAKTLVELVATRLNTHARHFLRVDLIKKCDGRWYINELEPFGNTFLHMEVNSDSYEFFPRLVAEIKEWMRVV